MAKILVAMIMVVALASLPLGPYFCRPRYASRRLCCWSRFRCEGERIGFPCKPAFSASDFFSARLATPGATNYVVRSGTTTANVNQIPGLNTLGISMARIDFAPLGLNPPHTHPRATEIVYVLEGTLEVWFITTANVLVSQSIKTGDVFVFPKALLHFQKNSTPNNPASIVVAYNRQLAGNQAIAATLFTSKPSIPNDVLAQAFQISSREVAIIRRKLTSN